MIFHKLKRLKSKKKIHATQKFFPPFWNFFNSIRTLERTFKTKKVNKERKNAKSKKGKKKTMRKNDRKMN